MPITVTLPQPSSIFGPGSAISFQSSLIGPFPTGTLWRVFGSVDSEHQQLLSLDQKEWTGVGDTLILGHPQTRVTVNPSTIVADGHAAFVSVELVEPPATVVDSGQAAGTWSNTAGLQEQIPAWSQPSAQGGLTTEEHGWLDQVQQFITNTAQLGGRLGLQTLAGGILEHPDVGLMHLCDPPMTLSGRGTLTRPATGIGVNAYGLAFSVASAPPGAGTRQGSILVYGQRVAQLVTMHRSLGGSELLATQVFDLVLDTFAWVWEHAFPEEILFDVTPGYTVSASWLCVTFPV